MEFLNRPGRPPRPHTRDGAARRVGGEVEFAGVGAKDGAGIVRRLFGGVVAAEDAHRFHVTGTSLGDFTCELDTRFAHERDSGGADQGGGPAVPDGLRAEMRRVFGNISSLVLPCEIVCPPIAHDRLAELDAIVHALTDAGAEGTRASPLYAFGAQLNPEIATDAADWLTAVLKAYLLLSPWLRAAMGLDLTRRAVAFADPFPRRYVGAVLQDDYWPETGRLIDDHLAANPTRNRELDLLPLFAWLDADRVRAAVDDPRIKARPAFHYRLPDAKIGEPGWSLCLEWNRWLLVERLAEDRALLGAMAQDYLRRAGSSVPRDWPVHASQWLLLA